MNISTPARTIGSIAALVAAYTHISLYQDGYKDIPIANIGTQFLLNAAGGVAIAIGLMAPLVVSSLPVWATKAVATGGTIWAVMSLIAYSFSHSDRGWMGYNDGPGFFMPSPEGAITVTSEAVVLGACLVLLIAGIVPARGRG